MSIAENIKEIRQSQGLTQDQLAKKIDIDRTMIAKFERGIKCPSLLRAQDLADALNCSVLDFLKK